MSSASFGDRPWTHHAQHGSVALYMEPNFCEAKTAYSSAVPLQARAIDEDQISFVYVAAVRAHDATRLQIIFIGEVEGFIKLLSQILGGLASINQTAIKPDIQILHRFAVIRTQLLC